MQPPCLKAKCAAKFMAATHMERSAYGSAGARSRMGSELRSSLSSLARINGLSVISSLAGRDGNLPITPVHSREFRRDSAPPTRFYSASYLPVSELSSFSSHEIRVIWKVISCPLKAN